MSNGLPSIARPGQGRGVNATEPAPIAATDPGGRAAPRAPVTAVPDGKPASGPAAVTGPAPAGGGLGADGAPPAGLQALAARTWTLELPAGLPLLSQNGRLHHFERNRRSQSLKKAAWAMALQAKLPHLERAAIVVEYQPASSRDTDPDNVPPASGKPCIDGLVAAGVLLDDSQRYVTDVSGVIGPKFPRGRIILHITEVAA